MERKKSIPTDREARRADACCTYTTRILQNKFRQRYAQRTTKDDVEIGKSRQDKYRFHISIQYNYGGHVKHGKKFAFVVLERMTGKNTQIGKQRNRATVRSFDSRILRNSMETAPSNGRRWKKRRKKRRWKSNKKCGTTTPETSYFAFVSLSLSLYLFSLFCFYDSLLSHQQIYDTLCAKAEHVPLAGQKIHHNIWWATRKTIVEFYYRDKGDRCFRSIMSRVSVLCCAQSASLCAHLPSQ